MGPDHAGRRCADAWPGGTAGLSYPGAACGRRRANGGTAKRVIRIGGSKPEKTVAHKAFNAKPGASRSDARSKAIRACPKTLFTWRPVVFVLLSEKRG